MDLGDSDVDNLIRQEKSFFPSNHKKQRNKIFQRIKARNFASYINSPGPTPQKTKKNSSNTHKTKIYAHIRISIVKPETEL